MQNLSRRIFIFLFAVVIQGCASLMPTFEPPEVQVTAVEPLPVGRNGDLRFRIHLRVHNPNNMSLSLSGIHYNLSLAGHKVITGSASNLPQIPAFGQDDIALDASTNLMGSFLAAAELLSMRGDTVPYTLDAKLGLQNSILPYIKIRKDGEIKLNR